MSSSEETSTWPDPDPADPDELDPDELDSDSDPETEPDPWSGLSSGAHLFDELKAEEESESDENEELEAEHEE